MATRILDEWGKPYALPDKPRRGFEYPVRVKDRRYEQYGRLIRGLDPDLVWSAFLQAYEGNVSWLQAFFEQAIKHDGKLYALDQRRRNGVAGLDFELRPYVERPCYGDEPGEPEESDKKLCDQVAEILFRIPNLQDHVKHMLDAIGKGFSILQINWVDDKAKGQIRPFMRFIPQRKLSFQRQNSEEILENEWPRMLTTRDLTYGEEMEEHRYIYAVYRDASEPWKCGVMWPCMWWYLRKHEAWSQLMATGERFAEPALVAYVGTEEMNGQLVSSTEDALEAWGPGTSVIVPGTGGPLKTDDGGRTYGAYIDQPQVDLRIPKDFWNTGIESCDREMAIAWSGGNLLTDTTGGTGTYSASQTQRESEKQDIRAFDADWLSMGPMDRLIELICQFNWGEDAAAHRPHITFPGLTPSEDLKYKAEVYKLIGETAWDVVRGLPDKIRDDLDVPETGEEEAPEMEEPMENEPVLEEPAEDQEEPAEESPGGIPEEHPEDMEERSPEERAAHIVEGRVVSITDEFEIGGTSTLHACGCIEQYKAADTPKGVKKLRDEIAGILKKVNPYSVKAAEEVQDRVTEHLLRMKEGAATQKSFTKQVLRHIDREYAALSTELEAAGLGDWFAKTYEDYKKRDFAIWKKDDGKPTASPPGGPPGEPPIAVKFGNKDRRAMAHIRRSTGWFFSKFTENETYRKPMENFLGRVYSEQGAMLNARNPKVVEEFGKVLGKTTKNLSDMEIDRIARTTVARAREQARIMQMADAGVVTAEVVTHPDACEICSPYSGKKIDVQSEVDYIQATAQMSDEEWQETARAHTKQAMRGVPPHEFKDGGGAPLYHPNCRCSVSMVFER